MSQIVSLLFGALIIGLGFILLNRITEWAQGNVIKGAF